MPQSPAAELRLVWGVADLPARFQSLSYSAKLMAKAQINARLLFMSRSTAEDEVWKLLVRRGLTNAIGTAIE